MHSYTGIVVRGKGRAKALGYPTANIALADDSVSGIYAARVKTEGAEYMAAAFADQKRKLLEAHILDYPSEGGSVSGGSGKSITMELCKKIREPGEFSNDEDLRWAIVEDIKNV